MAQNHAPSPLLNRPLSADVIYGWFPTRLSSSVNGLASDYRRFRAECAEAVEAERAGLAGFRAEQEAALAGVKRALLGQMAEAESQNSGLIDEMNQASCNSC